MNTPETVQLPRGVSTFAEFFNWLYYAHFWISAVMFFGIAGLMFYFVWRYRRRPGHDAQATPDHKALEIAWTVLPLFVLIFFFHFGFEGWLSASVAPRNALEIRVTGKQWLWEFKYPNGMSAVGELRVPAGKPVKLIMSSADVIHSFFVPAFRVKKDVLPGHYTTMWFEANEAGDYQVYCTEYCGTSHSGMLATLKVLPEAEFNTFLEQGAGRPKDKKPDEWGAELYKRNACITCHSTNGTPLVGPTFKGLFGRSETLTNGTSVVVDENYLRESMLRPQAKIVKGYENAVMPAMPLSDEDVDSLIAYIKTLK